MIRSRLVRVRSALVALAGMLLVQLAAAGYVCPLNAGHAAGESAAAMQQAQAGEDAMPGCTESAAQDQDTSSAALCHAHCQVDNQSLDRHELPAFQAALPDPVLSVVVLSIARGALDERFEQPAFMTRATSPPIPIRNCCFRT